MRNRVILDEQIICDEYRNSQIGVESIALKYHVGKKKIIEILDKNNIQRKKRGAQSNNEIFIVKDWKIEKYPFVDGKHYIAFDEKTDFSSKDIKNNSGVLTTYIKKTYGVETPTLYDRRMYYMRTGNYWWEQWLKVLLVDDAEVKHCPYCDWVTCDLDNKSGVFEQHLISKHNMTKMDFLREHPEEREYFRLANKRADLQMETDENKFVICQICGEKVVRLGNSHLRTHGLTKYEYILRFGSENLYSNEYSKFLVKRAHEMNASLDGRSDIFSSKAEIEIKEFINSLGFECGKNRSLLNGRELDIYIPSKNIAVEYNGLKWHTEFFGKKDKKYHLDKLNKCKLKGIKLITIFEDEYILKKEIVESKLQHILQCDYDKPKIAARKCIIKLINSEEASDFLEKNHIQGFVHSTVYIGAYYREQLIGVMLFTKQSIDTWELVRFATDINYVCQGVGGKMFSFFKNNYSFKVIKSFADRRWTTNDKDNLYVKLGFVKEGYIRPSYTYYNASVDRYKRVHKFNFRKQAIAKKFNLSTDLSEIEMARQIGYDRIWDCGLIKYVYYNNNN